MRRTFLILLLTGIASAQFRRFGNSFEDDSRENFFRRGSNFNRVGRFGDSDEDFFRGNRRRNFFDNSDENFFGRTRFDDSDEVFFGSNRNSFVSANNFNNRNPPPPTTTNRNTNFRPTSNFNRLRIDSVEDLFEDLFDDDIGDRLRAQNTLSRLNNNGFFRNSGLSSNRGITSFNTRIGNNRNTNSPGTRTGTGGTLQTQFTPNRNGLNHFSAATHSNRLASNQNNNRFTTGGTFNTGVPLRNTGTNRTPFTTNRFNQRQSSQNSIRSNPLSATKRSSSFSSPPGFNWPGGNGYYVSMTTGNSKPVTYFVKYDD